MLPEIYLAKNETMVNIKKDLYYLINIVSGHNNTDPPFQSHTAVSLYVAALYSAHSDGEVRNYRATLPWRTQTSQACRTTVSQTHLTVLDLWEAGDSSHYVS